MERLCLVDDCPGGVVAKNLCSRHYYNYRTHGTPLPEVRCMDCSAVINGATMQTKRCAPCRHPRERAAAQERAAKSRSVSGVRECYMCGADTEPTTHARKRCARCQKVNPARPCSEDGCDRPTSSLGLCAMHYKRVKRAEGAYASEPWDDRRRNNYHKRRALKAGSSAGPAFSNADVFERDGWVCGLCGGPVSPDVVYPDPLSASLDHVVPLSRGGAHSLDNSQLAHLACNVRKGAREDSVLAV